MGAGEAGAAEAGAAEAGGAVEMVGAGVGVDTEASRSRVLKSRVADAAAGAATSADRMDPGIRNPSSTS